MDQLLFDVFSSFSAKEEPTKFEPITAGHINHTYAVYVSGEDTPKYVMQKINTDIFKNPVELIENIKGF